MTFRHRERYYLTEGFALLLPFSSAYAIAGRGTQHQRTITTGHALGTYTKMARLFLAECFAPQMICPISYLGRLGNE